MKEKIKRLAKSPRLRRIYIENLGNLRGETWDETRNIHLDVSHFDAALITLLHELLHKQFPEMSETNVERTSRQLAKKLTVKEKLWFVNILIKKSVVHYDKRSSEERGQLP